MATSASSPLASSLTSGSVSFSRPSLKDHYSITILPRIADLNLSDRVTIPNLTSTLNDSNILDLGISKSIISSYIIKPTPKLVWSYALSPSSIIDCMDVSSESNNNDEDYSNQKFKYYIIGISDRRTHKVLLVQRNQNDQNETKSFELKVSHKVIDIKFFNNGKSIIVVYANGLIESYNLQIEEEDISLIKKAEELATSIKRKSEIIFHQFIDDISIKDKSDSSFILLITKTNDSLQYILVSYSSSRILEINSVTTALPSSLLKFAYVNGYIYQLNLSNFDITSVNIISFKQEKTVSINSLIHSSTSEIAFYAPSVDRLIISVNNKIYLINFKFESLLDTFVSKSSSSSEANPDRVYINQVLRVKGQSLNTVNSTVIYSYLKNKDKNVYLSVINLNVGLNKLNECLGKSLHNIRQPDAEFRGMVNLISDKFDAESKELSKELSEVYSHLKLYSKEKNFSSWERILIPYMKNESWESIKKSLNKPHKKNAKDPYVSNGAANTNGKIYNFKEFDVENDRIIDIDFIKKILLLIFKFHDDNKVEYIDIEFVPEYTLIYLLTNPLFPQEFTKGILQLFSESFQLTLLRQCIISCPNLTVSELLQQLVMGNNNADIFQDLINRLIDGFSTVEITKEFKLLVESNINDVKLDQLLNQLLQVEKNPKIWYLIEIIVDVGGLFNWTEETIEKLHELIELKIKALMANSYNLTLVNQVLLSQQPKPKKKSGKKTVTAAKSVIGDIISTSAQQQVQLDSILTIANASNNKHLDNPTIEISKKIPNYSVDRLIL
ncbi:U3 small nucleolar RNA-associated protein 8 [Scheffersomyces amazonensis]|uniref:U3 small nucleolar RNA-associated protein 8 n=1 Tax=Scheffersomyces amazonensis TaxID=1078765 RepID=UPI00315D93C5